MYQFPETECTRRQNSCQSLTCTQVYLIFKNVDKQSFISLGNIRWTFLWWPCSNGWMLDTKLIGPVVEVVVVVPMKQNVTAGTKNFTLILSFYDPSVTTDRYEISVHRRSFFVVTMHKFSYKVWAFINESILWGIWEKANGSPALPEGHEWQCYGRFCKLHIMFSVFCIMIDFTGTYIFHECWRLCIIHIICCNSCFQH